MHFHKTPPSIVKLLRKHVPKNAESILDPAVGEGALLSALYPYQLNPKLTLVDIDESRLNPIKSKYNNASIINSDFLKWAEFNSDNKFDLIITNPPFSARVEKWVKVGSSRIPIEMAFLKKCIELLEENGTLLLIAPDTVVNSLRLKDDRQWCFSQGAFKYVYQLPAKSFENIEAAFYFVVFKKGSRQNKVILRNIDKKGEIEVSLCEVKKFGFRLDFSYYFGKSTLETFIPTNPIKLSSISKIYRGPIREDYKKPSVNHSDSFVNGAWLNYREANPGDLCIAVKRVSRNANFSFGLFPTNSIRDSTDCILFIESSQSIVFKLLFFLRVTLSNSNGSLFILKGSGAKFIQVQALKDMPYFDVAEIFPEEFNYYIDSYKKFDVETCANIEKAVYSELCKGNRIITSFENHMHQVTQQSMGL